MLRFAWLALLPLAACASAPAEKAAAGTGYAGTVQKVFRIVRQGADLRAMGLLGKWGSVLQPVLQHNEETHQYIVRTPHGELIAQSDEEFPVGECVEIIPHIERPGPAYRYGEATVVRSQSCRG